VVRRVVRAAAAQLVVEDHSQVLAGERG
jgi:hypothetical protein